MIKLKTLLSEEKKAFEMEAAGKIKFSTVNNDETSININMFSVEPDEYLGYITLTSDYTDLGNIKPKTGYLFVDFIKVVHKEEGFGFLLYKEALKYCRKNRYRGLVSGKAHRIGKTEKIWSKITTSEDEYYSYCDITELGKKLKYNK